LSSSTNFFCSIFLQISAGKLLENDVPVFVVTFATQEVLCFKDIKSGEVVVGAQDRVEQCHYAAIITRLEDQIDNDLTGGWKVVEMARRSARSYL
jgi:import inner membrane translocase subunit TIM44